ncbi:MAG: IS1182 family transposase [Bacteroidales bacterium]
MLAQQQRLSFSNYMELYDLIVPPTNLLRRINDLIDFSFVHEELINKYSSTRGRVAECPIRMFKYLLLKTIFDISDVDVVERSRYDMSFKYFLDMTPEEDVINPSSLTKFRKLRLEDMDLLELLISKTVSIALEQGIIKSSSVIVDATHTASRSNPHSPIEVLKLRSRKLRKAIYDFNADIKSTLPTKNEDDDLEHELAYSKTLIEQIKGNEQLSTIPTVSEKLNLLEEAVDDTCDHYTLSEDQDARIGHKSKVNSFFGYKTHIGMTEERIITAAVVTSGEKGDGLVLADLIEMSQRCGIKVETIIGDTAYSGKRNLKLAEDKNIKLVSKLNPSISQGFRKEEDRFDYNKDAGMFVCPAGHMAKRKVKQGSANGIQNQNNTYYFDIAKCKVCSRRDGCYKPGAKSKSYSVPIIPNMQKEQLEFQETEYFKEKAKKRYKIEAKNGELKNVYGYDRAWSYGLSCMQMQGALTIFAANLKRILKLA